MTAARARRTVEIGITERTFILDLPAPAQDTTPGFDFFLFTRLRLELKTPELFGAESILGAIWKTAGAQAIKEIGVTRAKALRCWKVFGDPRH